MIDVVSAILGRHCLQITAELIPPLDGLLHDDRLAE
jgi:hypothetical protein